VIPESEELPFVPLHNELDYFELHINKQEKLFSGDE
jgi:hypothetical protein